MDSPGEKAYLVTIPRLSPVDFVQLGREVRCGTGGILLERGDAPYRFRYDADNDLHVMKVERGALAERIAQPDRHCARAFDGTQASGLLFSSMMGQAHVAAGEGATHSASVVGRQLLELLALVLENDPRAVTSASSAVRAAHLRRAEAYIRANLTDPALSPDTVANACSISKRYLHDRRHRASACDVPGESFALSSVSVCEEGRLEFELSFFVLFSRKTATISPSSRNTALTSVRVSSGTLPAAESAANSSFSRANSLRRDAGLTVGISYR